MTAGIVSRTTKKRTTNGAPGTMKKKAYARMPPPPSGCMVVSEPIQSALPPSGVVGESFELRIGESFDYRGDTYYLSTHPSHREVCLQVNRCPTPITLKGDDLSLTIPRFVIFDVMHVYDGDAIVGLRFVTTWSNPNWDAPRKSLVEFIAERRKRESNPS